MKQAIWNGTVVAETDDTETIVIEGNVYFPPSALKKEYFKKNPAMHSTCPWKGEASYYDLDVKGEINEGAAWYYPTPKKDSIPVVGQDFAHYIGFWRGVEVR